MSVLQALDSYYERMAARGEAEPPGFARAAIGFAIVLAADGTPVGCIDLREQVKKKLVPRKMSVPIAPKRTSGPESCRLWDKTAYVLGRTAKADDDATKEHATFRKEHLTLLGDAIDPGLVAVRRFVETWQPARFDAPPFSAEMLDANLVFRLDGDQQYVHERPAARALLAAHSDPDTERVVCLITGQEAPRARLHPAIKGVDGAQTTGASLVSFNFDAVESYGKKQGANAPTSLEAAFRYGAALNALLERGRSRNRLQRAIGDATTVFWADASALGEDAAGAAEDIFAAMLAPPEDAPPDDAPHAARVRDALEALARGKLPALGLAAGVRFHVLGLAPNAARLSVRFWLTDSFGAFAANLAQHHADIHIEPRPWLGAPSVARLVLEASTRQRKRSKARQPVDDRLVVNSADNDRWKDIPPLLAGEVMRAILAGTPYPRSLLAAAIIRLRAGDDAGNGWHAAASRAVLAREARLENKEQPPVSLDRDHPSPAYNLGRMFAMCEIAQRMALGHVNATIRDRYFGAASATPANVFPLLLRGVQNHLSKLRKEGKGGWIEMELNAIAERLAPDLPRSLALADQGRFAIGYYHQRRTRVGGKPADEIADEDREGNRNDD